MRSLLSLAPFVFSTELASGVDVEVAITGTDAIFNSKLIRNTDNNKLNATSYENGCLNATSTGNSCLK